MLTIRFLPDDDFKQQCATKASIDELIKVADFHLHPCTADTGDKEDELRLSVKISDAVQSLVGRLSVTPSFVIAKGGITSSDVGTKALAVKKANVLGQIKPGIPVWQTGQESKFPMTPYVIFPGNVGEITTLKEAVEVLMIK